MVPRYRWLRQPYSDHRACMYTLRTPLLTMFALVLSPDRDRGQTLPTITAVFSVTDRNDLRSVTISLFQAPDYRKHPRLHLLYNRVASLWHRLAYCSRQLKAMYWPLGPVYIRRFSRDCDYAEREWVEEHPSLFSVRKSMEEARAHAEGPEHALIISEKEFLRDDGHEVFRDRAAEMAGY